MESKGICEICQSENFTKAYLEGDLLRLYCAEHDFERKNERDVKEIPINIAKIMLANIKYERMHKLSNIMLALLNYQETVQGHVKCLNYARDKLISSIDVIYADERVLFDTLLPNIQETIEHVDIYQSDLRIPFKEIWDKFDKLGISGIVNGYKELNLSSEKNTISLLHTVIGEYLDVNSIETNPKIEKPKATCEKYREELNMSRAEISELIKRERSRDSQISQLREEYDRVKKDSEEAFHRVEELNQHIKTQQDKIHTLSKGSELHSREVYDIGGNLGKVLAVAINKDLRIILANSKNIIRNFKFGIEYSRKKLIGHTKEVTCLALTKYDSQLVTGSLDETIKIWNIAKDSLLWTTQAHSLGVLCVKVTRDSKLILSGGADLLIKVWNYRSSTCIAQLDQHTGYINCLDITSDDLYIVSGSDDSTIRVWNLNDKVQESVLEGHHSRVLAHAVPNRGRFVVSGGMDKIVKIWSLETMQNIYNLVGHSGPIHSVVISWDSKYIVSGGGTDDMSINIWDIEQRKLLETLKGDDGRVLGLAISKDDRYIVSGGDDHKRTVRIWHFTKCRD